MLKIMTVMGTRPEAIKLVPVVKELDKHPGRVQSIVCVTGQHRQMLDQVLDIFHIRPDIDLDIMQPNQTLSSLTARLLLAFDDVINQHKPDWILVQGDTTTVMAASLVAFYHGVKVGHVEAGLRTHDKRQPFPEEINRRIADVLADLYFAPTEHNRQNLLCEGVNPGAIIITGNTVIDTLLMTAERVKDRPIHHLPGDIGDKKLILVTAHRRENFGEPLKNICYALKQIADQYHDRVHIVFPVHLNPNVQETVRSMLGDVSNISLIEPADYETFVGLMIRAHLVLSDSGGLQEESPSLDTPVLVLRETTERPEAVESGATRLVGTDPDKIITETRRLLDDPEVYRKMAEAKNPYGDGQASERIIQAVLNYSLVPTS